MRKKCLIPILIVFSLLSIALVSYAKTSEEYVDEVYKLIEKGQFDEALAVVHKGMEEYPGNIGLVFAGAEVYHNKKDYETAIANYLNVLKAIGSTSEEAPAALHNDLVDAYNELGQKHYFSKELCLRIIYHTEKYLELNPQASQDDRFIEFLRKSIGHYDVASIGGNVKMMETGGDGMEFQLLDDNISNDEKMRYKDKTMQRIKEYDAVRQASSFQKSASDKTIEGIIQLINQRVSAINSTHFKKTNNYGGRSELLEEVFYKQPDKFKAIQPEAISIINNGIYYVIDPQTNNITHQENVDFSSINILKSITLINLKESAKYYNLNIEKIVGCPEFLTGIYDNGLSANLYLIAGKLKDKDPGPYPPTPKVEYFIDTDLGLCVAAREYWIGVLGSGHEEELARETIVKKVQKYGDNLYLPLKGTTRGLVEELSSLKEDWSISDVSLNQGISDTEFSVNK